MIINGVQIDQTFAEAFPMKATRVVITAQNHKWAHISAQAFTGFATSVIACGCEAGIERGLSTRNPGRAARRFGDDLRDFGRQGIGQAIENPLGQCVFTFPEFGLFAGYRRGRGDQLGRDRVIFGDGWQISKSSGSSRYWRVPVMDGEFVCE